jgi:hypothetical protein
MRPVNLLAISAHNGTRLAELGFLLAAIAGGLVALAALAPSGAARAPRLLGGLALAAGSVLLIIATRWGHFG